MLTLDIQSITLQKLGNIPYENEDNFLVASELEKESDNISKFAVSDGATESSFSKEWSDLLVSAYKDQKFDEDNLPHTLATISQTWYSIVNEKDLPWYAQQKLEFGAFAAFIGLTINKENSSFNTIAIGDCNLFHIKDNSLIVSFPINKSEDFGNTPFLLASNNKYQIDLNANVKYTQGVLNKNDILILATDALSAWILKDIEKDGKPWKLLDSILSSKRGEMHFNRWVKRKIQDKEIKNDDVTLLLITIK